MKYTRAYITHRKRIDPKLESEDAYLENQLLKNEFYNLNQAIWNWKGDKYLKLLEQKQEKLKTKRHLNQLKNYDLEDVINDNISWERN